MALNVSLFDPWTIFLGALIVVVGVIIALTIVERKLNKKIVRKKDQGDFFKKKLEFVKTKEPNPQKFLISLDALARDFLSQKYNIDRDAKYSELIRTFKKQGNL